MHEIDISARPRRCSQPLSSRRACGSFLQRVAFGAVQGFREPIGDVIRQRFAGEDKLPGAPTEAIATVWFG